MWNRETQFDGSVGFAEPIASDNLSSSDNALLSESADGSVDLTASATGSKRPSSDLNGSLPPSKRASATTSRSEIDMTHANPIDDRILSKRKGKYMGWIQYSYSMYIHI